MTKFPSCTYSGALLRLDVQAKRVRVYDADTKARHSEDDFDVAVEKTDDIVGMIAVRGKLEIHHADGSRTFCELPYEARFW